MTNRTQRRTFKVSTSVETLDDLRERIRRTRFPDTIHGSGWEYGVDPDFMKTVASYWANSYDWKIQEAKLNAFNHFIEEVDGCDIHFIHQKGKGTNPIPLVLCHGWPGSFFEFLTLIPLLTDPAAYGGDPKVSFDVVVPSLPGFGFSGKPTAAGMSAKKMGTILGKLMLNLGYEKFAGHGGDWGASVVTSMALQYPEHVIGLHLNYIAGRFVLISTEELGPNDEDRAFLDSYHAWWDREGGYTHQYSTRPHSLAFAVGDSPIGLAAWIIDKFRAWSDCNGDVLKVFTLDDILTNIMIYWISETAGSASRIYFESSKDPLRLGPRNKVMCPVGVATFPMELPMASRLMAERGFNVTSWVKMPKGGHFAAMEQPALMTSAITEFFRTI